ncbi:hypothetical protein K402DRAFT_131455 [Aulographum hederae CBS 113979]|uniref:Uncharacterized protein n=1 Tax=Aulographum hederae CBS 113979 TaxID=1176131 RepID=A0A6G1HF37_9PEZI|nr:hypothetical protein K402DRAFT_131455 [Aulographum hederae CBS 113979]
MLRLFTRKGNEVPTHPPYNPASNPFQAKRTWPPDFSKLSHKQQFRLERRYKRRCKLKWARPGWTKATKLAQYGCALFVLGYGVLYMDWDKAFETHRHEEELPFHGIRVWYKNATDSLWTAPKPASSRPHSDSSSTS